MILRTMVMPRVRWVPCVVLALSTLRAQAPMTAAYADGTAAAGLDFTYRSGAAGGLHLPEIMGPGAALFDFDNDGDLDVYLVQAGALGPKGEPRPASETDRLYRNDLDRATKAITLVDISRQAGLVAGGYAMGVAAGDYDNDGWTDLLITGYGSTRLLRNDQGRRLADTTTAAGVSDTGWSVSASFLDYDRDGWLDLYLARYVRYAPVNCVLASGRRDYCGPKSFTPVADRLFHNVRGRFEDVSAAMLDGLRPAPGLGVAAADVNGDGFVDLYVANDGADNLLFLNREGRGFKEDGLLAGVALSAAGIAQAGMGVDAGDADEDGDLDLVVTNLTGEASTLYLNAGAGVFEDVTAASGLFAPSLPLTGFGTRWLDYDNDGRLDLIAVNGAVHLADTMAAAPSARDLAQRPALFRNAGGGRWTDVTGQAGAPFARADTSRGLAVGDIDNDGDPDLLVATLDAPARLLLNRGGEAAAWLGVRLTAGGRDALGATAWLRRKGAPTLVRHVHADGSYASSSDPRLLFGLSSGSDVESLEVRWPDGSRERYPPPALRAYTTLQR